MLCAALTVWLLWPTVAAAQPSPGLAETHYRKAYAYYKSKPPDYVNAAIWYRRGAELGHAASQNDLGWLYPNGWGVPRDPAQAIHWYRQSAAQSYATAQVNLGWLYHNGLGVPRDYGEALRWYSLAAAQNDATAADNLGVLYRDGLGVRRDHAEAVAWFRKSAAAGYSWGQTDLGWMYYNGWGVGRDDAEAMKWFRQAAAQGNGLAQNNLGVMYRDGLGVPRDLDQAIGWFRKATAVGDQRAQQSLRHLESRQRGMDPWETILAGQNVQVALTRNGWVDLFAMLAVQLPAGKSIDVEIPIKVFTDAELRELGVLQPSGRIVIHQTPKLPYKPMRAATQAQQKRFFDDFPAGAIAIYWPPYVVVASGVDKQPPGSKTVVRERVERLYER